MRRRDGIVYSVAWRAADGDVPDPPPDVPDVPDGDAAPPVGDAAGGCTCLTGFPYPLPCPLHPRRR
jgi:hypothetical protein